MSIADTWRRLRRGPWRVAVAEESMTPAPSRGDWLLLDPAPRRWPRRGSVVVVRQPGPASWPSAIGSRSRRRRAGWDRVRSSSATRRGCSATRRPFPSTRGNYGPVAAGRAGGAGVVPLLAAAPDRANPAAPRQQRQGACQHRLEGASSGSSRCPPGCAAPERRCRETRGPRPSPQALPISSRAASSICRGRAAAGPAA